MTAHAMEASSAWVMDLAATLLAKETATASVDALVAVMRVRSRRFRDVFGAFFFSREPIVFSCPSDVSTRPSVVSSFASRPCGVRSGPRASR